MTPSTSPTRNISERRRPRLALCAVGIMDAAAAMTSRLNTVSRVIE
ncbi:hypothetical protein ACFY9N_03785 [Microbacterium sp. NPDC008134]